MADTSAAATAQLARAVAAAALPASARGACTFVFADAAAAAQAAAQQPQLRAVGLQQACKAELLSGPLLLVAPAVADVSAWV